MNGGLNLPVTLDALVVVLLVVTIVYAVILNRKLTVLRNAKGEMEAVVAQFAQATAQAENGIRSLKAHAKESGASLESTVNRAHGLADDLSFLIERGNNLADQLEGVLAKGRARGAGAKATPRMAPREAQGSTPPAAEASPEETALLNALRGVR